MRGNRSSSPVRLSEIFSLKNQWGCLDFSHTLEFFDFIVFSLTLWANESKVDISTAVSGIPCFTLQWIIWTFSSVLLLVYLAHRCSEARRHPSCIGGIIPNGVNIYIVSHLRKRDVLGYEVNLGGWLVAGEEVSVFLWTATLGLDFKESSSMVPEFQLQQNHPEHFKK